MKTSINRSMMEVQKKMKLRENMVSLLIIMQFFGCGSSINTFKEEDIYKKFITVNNCSFQLEGKSYYYN